MAAALFCQGCGASVAIPEGYARNKMRCPQCGVMIAVALAASAAPSAKKRAVEAPPSPAGRTCAACGQPLSPGVVACPECAAAAALAGPSIAERPRSPKPPAPPEAVQEAPAPRSVRPPQDDDDDNGLPYEVRASDKERLCPACARVLEGEEVVCPGCDFDLVRGRQAVRVWPTVQRQWDSGLSPQARWTLFAVAQGIFLTGGVVGAVLSGDICAFVGPSLLFTGMITFLLGTWFRTEVTRNPKGRVRIALTTYVCFVARPPQMLRLADYEGVISGKVNESKFYEWLLMLIFVPTLIGMVLWWYYVIHKETFYVALTRDHGYPDELIFRGWSEETMKEVEKVLRELVGFSSG